MSRKPRSSLIPAILSTDEPPMSVAGKIFRSLGCLAMLLFISVFIAATGTIFWNWASVRLAHLGAPHPAATRSGMPIRPAVYTPVVDAAGILTTNEQRALSTKLQDFERTSTTQLVVVTVPSLNDNELADYAQQLYHSWGIGQRQNNNGALVLVAMQEHGLRIQTGYGLEGAIPDATCERLITDVLKPAFKSQHYYAGLDAVTTQLIQLAQGETASFAPPAGTTLSWGLVLLIVGLLLALLFRTLGSEVLWGWTAIIGRGGRFSSSGSSSDGSSSSSSSSGDSWGGGDSGGGGASGSW